MHIWMKFTKSQKSWSGNLGNQKKTGVWGNEILRVRVIHRLGTSLRSWVRVVLGTGRLGYGSSRIRRRMIRLVRLSPLPTMLTCLDNTSFSLLSCQISEKYARIWKNCKYAWKTILFLLLRMNFLSSFAENISGQGWKYTKSHKCTNFADHKWRIWW